MSVFEVLALGLDGQSAHTGAVDVRRRFVVELLGREGRRFARPAAIEGHGRGRRGAAAPLDVARRRQLEGTRFDHLAVPRRQGTDQGPDLVADLRLVLGLDLAVVELVEEVEDADRLGAPRTQVLRRRLVTHQGVFHLPVVEPGGVAAQDLEHLARVDPGGDLADDTELAARAGRLQRREQLEVTLVALGPLGIGNRSTHAPPRRRWRAITKRCISLVPS